MMQEEGTFDVVIVGGGPAGLSALHWCRDLGMSAVLIEKQSDLGGQLLETFNPITNYLGIAAANGREMLEIFLRSLAGGLNCITGTEIDKIDLDRRTVTTANGNSFAAKAIIIATGVRRRELGIAGEREFRDRGVMRSGSAERNRVAGKRIVIIGGGDAALENALILSENAARVTVVHRREELAARAHFVDEARKSDTIRFDLNTIATAIHGDEHIKAVEIQSLVSGETRMIEADGVLIRAGWMPNSEIFSGQLERDSRGYIDIDRNCGTSKKKVYAIGDVTGGYAPTIAAATGQASIAAKAVRSVI